MSSQLSQSSQPSQSDQSDRPSQPSQPGEDRIPRLYTITELADELGVTARAIRFYEAKELLSPQRVGKNRVYTVRDRARLLLILRGKRLGFSLAEVKEFLDLYDADPTQREQFLLLLRGVRRRVGELERQRRDLDLTLEELRAVEAETLAAMEERGIEEDSAPEPEPDRQVE